MRLDLLRRDLLALPQDRHGLGDLTALRVCASDVDQHAPPAFQRQTGHIDLLGRPQRTTGPDLGASVKVPDEIDVQRAREILDAIRKKLGEPGQSLIEKDYLERLLERF